MSTRTVYATRHNCKIFYSILYIWNSCINFTEEKVTKLALFFSLSFSWNSHNRYQNLIFLNNYLFNVLDGFQNIRSKFEYFFFSFPRKEDWKEFLFSYTCKLCMFKRNFNIYALNFTQFKSEQLTDDLTEDNLFI